MAVAGLLVACSLVYLSVRLDGLQTAAAVTRRVDATLRQAHGSLPAGAVILCTGLPDSIDAAYAYRNGCIEHVRLVWPDRQVTAAMQLDEVTTGTPVFSISPDGSTLIPLARATSHDTTR
jgi:hypothetical protein